MSTNRYTRAFCNARARLGAHICFSMFCSARACFEAHLWRTNAFVMFLACIVVHGHLLTKSHGLMGYGVAETVAVATNSLFHATFF